MAEQIQGNPLPIMREQLQEAIKKSDEQIKEYSDQIAQLTFELESQRQRSDMFVKNLERVQKQIVTEKEGIQKLREGKTILKETEDGHIRDVPFPERKRSYDEESYLKSSHASTH